MKACIPALNLSVLHLVSFSRTHVRNYFNILIPAILLSVSAVSFAGNPLKKGILKPISNNNYACLKTRASPLTGIEYLRTNLYLLNADSTLLLTDGVLTEFGSSYHDSVYLEDAYKFTNITENLGLNRYGAILCIERRPLIVSADTLFFRLWKTTRRSYQFEFVTSNLNHPGMEAFLEDAYTGTKTLLPLNGTSKMNFLINANAASANVNRFRIVFKTAKPPVAFASFTGYQAGNIVKIKWQVENEINISKYEIERSANGIDFNTVNTITAQGLHNNSTNYFWNDGTFLTGINFYRIKCIDNNGAIKLSSTINITIARQICRFAVYPNPVENNLINLQFSNQQQGVYKVKLVSSSGQVMYKDSFKASGANFSHTLLPAAKLRAGIYQLEITMPGNNVHVQQVMVR